MPTGITCKITDKSRNLRGWTNYDHEGLLTEIELPYYEDIEDSGGQAQYEEATVRGRSEEHIFYSQTSADVYSFTAKLVASMDEGDGRTAKTVWEEYLFLKSFQFPDYNYGKGPVKPPRHAYISIGNWFSHEGVIKDPSATFSKTCDKDGFPLIIDARFTFRVISPKIRDFRDVMRGL